MQGSENNMSALSTYKSAPSAHPQNSIYQTARRRRRLLNQAGITFLALAVLAIYLMPMLYAVTNSLKTQEQAADARAPILPSDIMHYEYQGQQYDVYSVPTD